MEKTGFIGLGIMGKPMALNLLKAGYPVQILESSNPCDEIVKAGRRRYLMPQHWPRKAIS